MSTVNDYAENSHDPLCVKYISGDDLPCICDLLAEHAQIIRADERERAGVRQEDTVTAHDPFCPMHDVEHLQAYVNKMKADARADERERAAAEGVRIARVTLDIARDDLAAEVRERLRAQVKALRHEDECDVSRGRERPETGMAECNCLRAEVLALLGGDDS